MISDEYQIRAKRAVADFLKGDMTKEDFIKETQSGFVKQEALTVLKSYVGLVFDTIRMLEKDNPEIDKFFTKRTKS